MNIPDLYRVAGMHEGKHWEVMVYAGSPGVAVDTATKRKAWDVLYGVTVTVIVDFIDTTSTIGKQPEAT